MTVKEIFPHPLSVHSYLLEITGSVGMYMESGLLDLLNIAPLNGDTYRPASLYYDSQLSSYYSGNSEALMGTIKVNSVPDITEYTPRGPGQSYSGVGCKDEDEVSEVTILNSEYAGKAIRISGGGFCPNQIGTLTRKRAQAFYPASVFSGKMRLFVQSVYGSNRTDYSVVFLEEYSKGLTIAGRVFNPYHNTNGHVLYTTSDFQYFILDITNVGISVHKLVPSNTGENLRQWLIENPQSGDELRRHEAYILSSCTFDEKQSNLLSVGDAYTKGPPLFYGWHSKWDGSEAHMVAFRQKSGTTNVWQTTHWKMTVDLTTDDSDPDYWKDGDNWSVTFDEEEGTQDVTFQVNDDVMWIPDPLVSGGMELIVTQANAFDAPTQVDSDVPMYAVYNYDSDEINIVRFSRTDLGSGDDAFGGNVAWGDSLQASLPGCGGDDACESKSRSDGSVIRRGFKVAGSSGWSAVRKEGAGVEVDGFQAWLQADTGPSFSAISQTTTCDGTPIDASDSELAVPAHGGEIDIDGNFVVQDTLVVPYYDCDSVYMGYWSNFTGDLRASWTAEGSYVLARIQKSSGEIKDHVWSWFFPSGKPRPHDYSLETSMDNIGMIHRVNLSGAYWDEIDVRLYSNGEFEPVHEQQRADSRIPDSGMVLPSCADLSQAFDNLQVPDWKDEPLSTGFEFDPVIFPTAETTQAITAKRNVTNNYRAQKTPGSSEYIDDGDYSYDPLSSLLSYVGHD